MASSRFSLWPVSSALIPTRMFWCPRQVLYFLRAFKSTGALIRMIFKVLGLSLPFLFVLLIVSGVVNLPKDD